MFFEYDPAKNLKNIEDRGISFERTSEFEFGTAWILVDTRRDYGEIRFRALGLLAGRLHALVFTETSEGIRVISLRKANKREEERYGQAQGGS